jgi:acyl-CoA reductase-like NAD-dependent aldehyde dehydrogenase
MALRTTREEAGPVRSFDRLYIGGGWVEPGTDEVQKVIDPATGEVVGRAPKASEEDVDRAVRAAREAFENWSGLPLEERLLYLERFYERYQARAEDVNRTLVAQVGAPISQARVFVGGSAGEIIPSAIENARSFAWEHPLETQPGSLIVREPIGVVAAVSPWNNPMFLALNKIAMALAAGCTVVHKPASITPGAAFHLAELADEAGLPPGVFNVLWGSSRTIGGALNSHPGVDMVDFTGSTASGEQVMRAAAPTTKKVLLELGGKGPSVVLDDADLETAARTTMLNCLVIAGQTCGALTRLIVPRDRMEEATEVAVRVAEEQVLGDTFDEGTTMGPVVSADARETVRGYIRSGIEEGATLATGGEEPPEGLDRGFWVRPTVFTDVGSGMRITQEEIFGPVLSIIPHDGSDEDAVRIANDSDYGLRGAVWSRDVDRAVRIAKRIRCGSVDINGDKFTLEAPWGGYKRSGFGRCMGRYGLEEFLQIKSVQIADDLAASYS